MMIDDSFGGGFPSMLWIDLFDPPSSRCAPSLALNVYCCYSYSCVTEILVVSHYTASRSVIGFGLDFRSRDLSSLRL